MDQDDPEKWWEVLQFGLQNLYDPDLDEWIVIDTFEAGPGEVVLPAECEESAAATTSTTTGGTSSGSAG